LVKHNIKRQVGMAIRLQVRTDFAKDLNECWTGNNCDVCWKIRRRLSSVSVITDELAVMKLHLLSELILEIRT
jgi:hypothetical protein